MMKITTEIESCYQTIGQTAIDIVQAKHKKIWVVADIQESVSSTGLYYQDANDKYYFVTVGTEKLDASMYQLYSKMREAGNEPFTTVEFSLVSNGHFEIKYSYDPDWDFSKQYERMLEWERVHFGPNVEVKCIE